MKNIYAMLLFVALNANAFGQALPTTSVVLDEVREMPVGEPATFNAVIRSQHDISLPATVDGELLWVKPEGSQIKRGEVIAKVDDRQARLQRNEQQLLADRAGINLAYLQGEVDRLSQLQEANLAAKTQLAEMVSRRDLAQNDLAVARSRVAQLDETLARTNIISPIDAIIVQRQRQGGEFSRRGESVVRIISPAILEVVASIPVAYLNRLDAGSPVEVSVNNTHFEAPLRTIVQSSDLSSQTFGVLLDVPSGVVGLIAAGQFANVTVMVNEQRRSLFVPRDAVVLRSDGSFVFRVDEENVATQVTVKIGAGQGELVAVKGELKSGDKVAVRGVESLQDGQSVLPLG